MIIRKYNVRIVFFLSSSPFFFSGRTVSIRRLHQEATWDLRLDMSSLDDGDDVIFDFLDQTNELLSFSLQDLLQHVSNLPSVLDQQFGCHYSSTSSIRPMSSLASVCKIFFNMSAIFPLYLTNSLAVTTPARPRVFSQSIIFFHKSSMGFPNISNISSSSIITFLGSMCPPLMMVMTSSLTFSIRPMSSLASVCKIFFNMSAIFPL